MVHAWNRLGWVCLAVSGLAVTPARAQAFNQVYGVASVTATVVTPGTAAQEEELDGDLVAGTVDGDVVVDPARGLETGTQAAGPRASHGSPLKPAAYRVAGRRGAAFALAMPDPASCVLTGSQATIPITAFKVSVAGGAATDSPGGLTLDPRGLQAFKVGASLRIAKGLPNSTYVGRFKVTLAYN